MPLEPNDDPTSTINFLQRLTMLSTMETYALAAGAVAAAYAAARSCGPGRRPDDAQGHGAAHGGPVPGFSAV